MKKPIKSPKRRKRAAKKPETVLDMMTRVGLKPDDLDDLDLILLTHPRLLRGS